MIFSGKTFLLLGACLYGVMITTVSRAEDTVTVTKPTQEDYQSLGKANSEYNNCLTGQAQQRLDEYSDPRQLASFAMGECAYVLEELHRSLMARGHSEQAATSSVRHINNRSANRLLGQLMRVMANRPAATEELEENPKSP